MPRIRTVKEYEAYVRVRDQLIFDVLEQAMLMGLTETATLMRATTAFNDDTGNLRNSIGYAGPIPTPKPKGAIGAIAQPAPLVRFVKRSGKTSIRAELHIGMEYASIVDQRTGFMNEAIGLSHNFFFKALADAGALIDRGLQ